MPLGSVPKRTSASGLRSLAVWAQTMSAGDGGLGASALGGLEPPAAKPVASTRPAARARNGRGKRVMRRLSRVWAAYVAQAGRKSGPIFRCRDRIPRQFPDWTTKVALLPTADEVPDTVRTRPAGEAGGGDGADVGGADLRAVGLHHPAALGAGVARRRCCRRRWRWWSRRGRRRRRRWLWRRLRRRCSGCSTSRSRPDVDQRWPSCRPRRRGPRPGRSIWRCTVDWAFTGEMLV